MKIFLAVISLVLLLNVSSVRPSSSNEDTLKLVHVTHDLLDSCQFGSQRGCATITAVAGVVNFIVEGVERGNQSAVALCDLTKAFDCGSHFLLLQKLNIVRDIPLFIIYINDFLNYMQPIKHGNRNPELSSLWESSPFYNESYYPEGYGQLTNAGKRTEFKLGQLLRRRFNTFLGDSWNINTLDVRSTNVNRTKMSAELVLSGLYPPRRDETWNIWLPWQPIPYNYFPTSSDPVLYPFSCATFTTAFAAIEEETEIANYIAERYNETLEIVSNYTGFTGLDASSVYDALLVQQQLGYPLEDWTKDVFPEPLHSLMVDYYYIMTNTTELRRILSGSLLKKIIADTESLINGTLSPSTRKMFVYSAHDINVGPMVLSLDAWKLVNPPPYGSHVIFEVHEIDDVYGFKIYYGDYTTAEPHGPLIIPGCAEFCPFDEFYALVEEILPSSDAVCYGS